MVTKIRVGIAGGAGYTAGELIRLLLNHPAAELKYIHSESHKGKAIHEVHRDLMWTTLFFSDVVMEDIDVLFLCMGHGFSMGYLQEHDIPSRVKIIDLGNDFRLAASAGDFIYGLPELSREAIRQANHLANPGCFATAIELALLPLAARNELREQISIVGITGATGAGQKPTEETHFAWRNENLSTYKVFTHNHLAEIRETLSRRGNAGEFELVFVPMRGAFSRGIFVNLLLRSSWSLEKLQELYMDYYSSHPFVVFVDEPLYLKQVVNSNYCYLHIEQQGEQVLITSIIDNLLKGASGQAIQNMNLMFGLEETTGLRLKSSYF